MPMCRFCTRNGMNDCLFCRQTVWRWDALPTLPPRPNKISTLRLEAITAVTVMTSSFSEIKPCSLTEYVPIFGETLTYLDCYSVHVPFE